MALIGTIRKNNWLLIALIGLGLAAFIMMDSCGSDKSIGNAGANSLGSIAGTKINRVDFEDRLKVRQDNFKSNDSYGQRVAVWNMLVQKHVLENEAGEVGLGVSNAELANLQFGPINTLSPLMASRFPDPSSQNQFGFSSNPDMAQIAQFKQILESKGADIDPLRYQEIKRFWMMHEDEVRVDRIQAKFTNLVSKSMYTPSWMVEKGYSDQQQKVNFNYVTIPFDEVSNDEVTLADTDLQTYLDANAARFELEKETRKIGYVAFDVVPTAKDSTKLRAELAKEGNRFKTAENDSSYVENYDDAQFVNQWLDQESVDANIKDFAFNAPVGDISQPFAVGNKFRLAKLIDRRILPDSAKCRHILVGDEAFNNAARQNPNLKLNSSQYAFFKQRADSIINVLNTDATANFDSLAAKHSVDAGSRNNGGVYDWTAINMWVPAFNDNVFFQGELNNYYTVKTQFGYHIIEPLGRKNITNTQRVRVAYVDINIEPSKETRKAVLSKVKSFIKANSESLDKFKSAAEADASIEYVVANPVEQNGYNIPNVGADLETREMVKFAFDNEKGDVSSKVYTFRDATFGFDNKYVAMGIESIQPAGKPSIDNIRENLTTLVRNQKKGEIIASKINTQDLNVIAQTFSSQVDTVSSISFNQQNITGLSSEPKSGNIVAAAFNLPLNGVSQPIVGENGVYIIQTTFKPAAGTPPENIAGFRKSIRTPSQNSVSASLLQDMIKNAKIKDQRSKFF